MKVDGSVAIVTGASSGFGKALAHRLADKGAKLVLVDISADAGQALETQLNAKDSNTCIFVQCNVTKKDQLEHVFQTAKTKFGRIDIVINNAGVAEKTKFGDDTTDAWMSVIDIDLVSVILGTRLAISEFRRQGGDRGGVVVNTASLAGLYPLSPQPVYSAAKSGVVMFTRSLAPLAKKDGIRVNAICPSFSPTSLLNNGVFSMQEIPKDKLVSVEMVVDAFMLAIEDDGIAGECIRVTPEYGINVMGRGNPKRPSKL